MYSGVDRPIINFKLINKAVSLQRYSMWNKFKYWRQNITYTFCRIYLVRLKRNIKDHICLNISHSLFQNYPSKKESFPYILILTKLLL